MSEKLLVIEDSAPILAIIKKVAERAGYEVDCAMSLYETENLLAQGNNYTVASIDFNLPDATQGEAIDAVLSQQIPSIVLTGSMDEKTRDSILKRAIVDYIPKETAQAFLYLEKLLIRLKLNKQVKVLIVDDSKTQRALVGSLLQHHNFVTLEAEDGQQALDVIEQNPDIRLVITDHEMPVMDGIRFVAELRRKINKDKMAVIGLSGAGKESLSARFIKNGANDFLSKPFCNEEFYCRVMQNIEHLEFVTQIQTAANTDYLTNLCNRRHFFETVPGQLKNLCKNQKHSCLAMIDIDHFKKINDTYGHDAGDLVIKNIAQCLQAEFTDCVVSRFGGEEFCLFMPDYSLDMAKNQLENFRQTIENEAVKISEGEVEYTVSIGLTAQDPNIDTMITCSDELLYKAKQSGRNQIAHSAS